MAEVQWSTAVISLISGGAMGAIINSIVSAYRNRIQPVGYRIDFLPLFQETIGISALQTKITVSDGQNECKFDNMYIADISIVNKGNKDFEKFTFGATLADGDFTVAIEPKMPDRHHKVVQLTPIKLDQPNSEIDFILEPFNRGDSYSLQLYVSTPSGKDQPSKVQLSTSESIRFVDLPTISEMFVPLLLDGLRASVEIGPIGASITTPMKTVSKVAEAFSKKRK